MIDTPDGHPLAILLPEVGLASETFIRQDVNELLPGGTVAVVDPPPGGASRHGHPAWRAEPPTLAFEPLPGDPPPPPDRVAALRTFLTRNRLRVVLIEYLDLGDRWFDHLSETGVTVWLRGHGIDLSARLRDHRLRQRYARYRSAAGVIVPSHAAAGRLRSLGLPAPPRPSPWPRRPVSSVRRITEPEAAPVHRGRNRTCPRRMTCPGSRSTISAPPRPRPAARWPSWSSGSARS